MAIVNSCSKLTRTVVMKEAIVLNANILWQTIERRNCESVVVVIVVDEMGREAIKDIGIRIDDGRERNHVIKWRTQ